MLGGTLAAVRLSCSTAAVQKADESSLSEPDCSVAELGHQTPSQLAKRYYTENELPQPQLPVAFGLLKVNPLPIIDVT